MQRIERILVDYFETSGVTVEHRDSEWFVEIDGAEVSLTALACALIAPPS